MTPKNNDAKGLCFTLIGLVDVVLMYIGYLTYNDLNHSTVLARIVALPVVGTVYVLVPDQPPGAVYLGVTGAAVFYFLLGVAILFMFEKWIVARRAKKEKTNRI